MDLLSPLEVLETVLVVVELSEHLAKLEASLCSDLDDCMAPNRLKKSGGESLH
jgi:hypothetical protein